MRRRGVWGSAPQTGGRRAAALPQTRQTRCWPPLKRCIFPPNSYIYCFLSVVSDAQGRKTEITRLWRQPFQMRRRCAPATKTPFSDAQQSHRKAEKKSSVCPTNRLCAACSKGCGCFLHRHCCRRKTPHTAPCHACHTCCSISLVRNALCHGFAQADHPFAPAAEAQRLGVLPLGGFNQSFLRKLF